MKKKTANKALLAPLIMAATLGASASEPWYDFTSSIPNGPTQHYGERPQNNNVEYYTDEKGNLRRRKNKCHR